MESKRCSRTAQTRRGAAGESAHVFRTRRRSQWLRRFRLAEANSGIVVHHTVRSALHSGDL